MIGVNTSIFKSAGRKLVNLLGALKDRAAYYENGTDSVAEKNHIDDLGILDKATILLTPTAYSDARVHSVKTYTGDELVTNGGFDTDSDWTKGTNWTIANGSANSNGTGLLYQTSVSYVDGKTYKVTFDASITSGGGTVRLGNTTSSTAFTNGSNVFYLQTDASNTTRYIFFQGNSFIGSIDNVSVVDVSSDFDFDRASSATRINSDGLVQDMQSITDPELVLNGDFSEIDDNVLIGDNSTFDSGVGNWVSYGAGTPSHSTDKLEVNVTASEGGAMIPTNSLFTGGQSGKLLKVRAKLWLGTMTNTAFKAYIGGVQENVTLSSTPTYYDFYLEPTGSGNLIIYKTSISGSAGTFFIDDVSVQQVDPNDRWTVGATWSLGDGVANYEGGSNSAIIQNITLTSGNTYNIKFTVSNASGNASIWIGDGAGGVNYFGGTYAPYANGSYDLYFTMPSNQTTLAFYGASSGSNFSIDNISLKDVTFSTDVDLARINYDSNGENGHILLEPSSTNLVTYSEDFNEWTLTRCSLGDKVLSPNGTISAYKIIPNTENAKHEISTSVSSYTTATVSLFAKAAEKHRLQITKSNWGTTDFDLLNETVTSGVGTIESYGNGWYRCTASYTASPSQSTIYIIVADDDGDVTYSGNNSDGIYFWGAQLEALPYATSYIPTLTGSTVTRAGEKLYGSGNSTLINSEEGVLYAEIAALADDTTYRFISLSDGTTGNRVVLGYHNVSNTVRGYVYSGTTIVATMSYAVDSIRDFIKLAIKYKRDDFALWVDGVKRGVDGAGAAPIGLDSLQFDSGDGSSFLYGKCKAVAVFDRALNDTELGNLTNNS